MRYRERTSLFAEYQSDLRVLKVSVTVNAPLSSLLYQSDLRVLKGCCTNCVRKSGWKYQSDLRVLKVGQLYPEVLIDSEVSIGPSGIERQVSTLQAFEFIRRINRTFGY